jgi:hypothetical protein
MPPAFLHLTIAFPPRGSHFPRIYFPIPAAWIRNESFPSLRIGRWCSYINQHPWEALDLYRWGWIDYTEELKITRRIAFLRRYDPPKDRLFSLGDADHEYAD